MSTALRRPGPLRHLVFVAAALGLGTLCALIPAELGFRLYGERGFVIEDLRPAPWGLGPRGIAEYDPLLGYVPRADFSYTWRGGWTANIDDQRIRRNGAAASSRPPQLPGILAIGDSSTFGDEVEDEDTWPARLEALSGRRVWNAGMGGYGIDQMVLRAERLLPRFDADSVVLSFVSDDITRCAYSYRQRWRPYFSLERGELVLTLPPGPGVPLPGNRVLTLLGHSYLARFVMTRVAPETWNRRAYRRVHHDEREVSGLLLARLARATEARGLGLLVVALSGADRDRQHVADFLARAKAAGVATLDLTPDLARRAADPVTRERWFRPKLHLSGHANGWVAARIAARLDGLESVE